MNNQRHVYKLCWLLLISAAVLLTAQGCRQQDSQQNTGNEQQLVHNDSRNVQLEELDRTAEELYRLAAAGELDKARQTMSKLADQVVAASFSEVTGVEGVAALSDAVIRAKASFHAVSLDPELIMRRVAALRFATDALIQRNQPMWLQYYKVLTEDTRQLEQAMTAGSIVNARAAYIQLSQHYLIIRPAVWISRTPSEAEMIDSLMTFFSKYTEGDSLQQDVLASGLEQWKEVLDTLFQQGADRSTAYMQATGEERPILWTLTIGSIIVAALCFAAWQMRIGGKRPLH